MKIVFYCGGKNPFPITCSPDSGMIEPLIFHFILWQKAHAGRLLKVLTKILTPSSAIYLFCLHYV